ncbi:M23 family metallopeptidase, partial [Enterococcus gallinarum]|uniref:M23 family metallopeptidase n=2 Tax=Enterococcus TaxID=1350 RepID=UPI0029529EE7
TYLYVNGGNFHYAAMIRQYVKVTESVGYVVPISKPVTVTSEFGYRQHPITGAYELHNGIDLVNGNPTTPIYASAAGEVVIAGSYPEWYGNYVVIKHSDGLYTGYAHQSQLRVSVGDTVKQGQQIGNMGTTGPSTGPHLHFQFFTNGPWPSSDDFINPREHIDF